MPEITSTRHPLVQHLVRLRLESAYRYQCQTLFFEGAKPIQELSTYIKKIAYTADYENIAAQLPGEKWKINRSILHKISAVPSPEGIIAEMEMPSFRPLEKAKYVVAFDKISDPGNMGTLLRTALAFNWDTVFLLPGGCDCFNEKVLRAARGAHFKIQLSQGTATDLQTWVQTENVQPLVAELRGKHPETISQSLKKLLVLGNEAHGASKKIHSFCQSVALPMSGEIESLNVAVAGGILLYLFSNQGARNLNEEF
jgi:TrmH family RNA methyltransferase